MPMVLSSSSCPVLRFQLLGVAAARGIGVEQKIFLQREQQHEIMLGDGRVIHAGREEQRDAKFGAGFHVNLVHANAVFAQDLQLRPRLFQNLARDGVVAADVAVHVADERERVRLVERAARGDDFPAGFFQQIVMFARRVLKRSGGQKNFHACKDKKNGLRAITEAQQILPELFEISALNPRPASERAMRIQRCLRLVGNVREDHGDAVAGVLVAGAGDDNAAALEFVAVLRRLQRHGHFRPFVERRRAAEFNAAFVDGNRVGGKFQT